jgi:hypothetical protein
MIDIPAAIAAIGALGTAAFGLVDALKALWGGPSRFGFGYIKASLQPFSAALAVADSPGVKGKDTALETLRANWLNGVPLADQKAKAKALIHLGLTAANADTLGTASGVDKDELKQVASKIDQGQQLDPTEITLFGRFDAIVSARIDAGFERADQCYRNSAKALALGIAIVLALIGAWMAGVELWKGLLVGIVATPLAPVAKDLSSALATAVNAVSPVKR